jgi:hypothetical protein
MGLCHREVIYRFGFQDAEVAAMEGAKDGGVGTVVARNEGAPAGDEVAEVCRG